MRFLIIPFILSTIPFYGQTQNTVDMNKKTIILGDSSIVLHSKINNSKSDILFLNIHEDEHTSIEAVEHFSETTSLNFVYLQHNKTRRIHFSSKKDTYSVDPNRIYTSKGRKATIEPTKIFKFRPNRIAKKLAKEIINVVNQYSIIVTMHNNTDINYSIKSYLPGEDESQNTADVFISKNWDADDFVYTTSQVYFDYLKKVDVNVILQDNTGFVNDGSLSVYCGKNGIPYLNIEAQKGHLTEQIKLVEIVYEMLNNVK
jgi:hypothetical protein